MKNQSKNEPTLSDIMNTQHTILETVHTYAKNNEVKFQSLANQIRENQKMLQDILENINDYAKDNEERFQTLETGFQDMKTELNGIQEYMKSLVTKTHFKTYLDDKLANFRGDIMDVMHEQKEKTMFGFGILHHNKTISRADFTSIANMKPFPKKVR